MLLPKKHFHTFLRWVQTGSIDRVKSIRQASHDNLKRLGVDRDLSKAVDGICKGSDQYDGLSLIQWMQKIQPNEKRAIWQLQAIDATAVKRS